MERFTKNMNFCIGKVQIVNQDKYCPKFIKVKWLRTNISAVNYFSIGEIRHLKINYPNRRCLNEINDNIHRKPNLKLEFLKVWFNKFISS